MEVCPEVGKIKESLKNSMSKTLGVYENQLATVRTGRATPTILESVKIDYYGTMTSISQVCQISVPEPRMLVIKPYERNMVKEVERALLKSELGINPVNEGEILRVTLPQLTEERRKEFVKVAKKYCEDSKIALRNERRKAVEDVKKLKKDIHLSEDAEKKAEADILDILHKYEKKVDEILKLKETEIMTV